MKVIITLNLYVLGQIMAILGNSGKNAMSATN